MRRLFINSMSSALQVIVMGAGLFFLYRHLLLSLGADKLGIWSLVLASTGISRVANLGLSGGVVKFVAKYAAREDHIAVSKVIQTTLITVGVVSGTVLIVAYPFADELLSLVIDPKNLGEALTILPAAALSIWCSIIAAIVMGGLDGYQRMDIRSGLMVLGTALYIGLGIIFSEKFSLLGLAFAQLAQYAMVLFGGYFILRRQAPLPIIPYQWDRVTFSEMWNYGVNYQIIGIMTLLNDPLTKGLLATYGGLAALGYYELASRMVLQFRSIIVNANRSIVPAVAELWEHSPTQITSVYRDSILLITLVSVPIYTFVYMLAPLISSIWIGEVNIFFVFSTHLLLIGWLINTLSVPAYFVYLGNGRLRWNTVSHVLLAFLNLLLSWILGRLLGENGVLLGWLGAIIISSLVIIIAYQLESRLSWSELLSKPNAYLAFASVVSIIGSVFILERFIENTTLTLALTSVWFVLVFFPPIWFHPMSLRIMLWTKSQVVSILNPSTPITVKENH